MEGAFNEKLTLTLAEAAEYSGIGRNSLEQLQRTDRNFPSFKVGSKTLIDRHLLVEYVHNLARNRVGEVVMNPVIAEVIRNRKMAKK